MMTLMLRSWRLGLLSMIPNYLPILMGLGFMAPASIDLDPATMMVASMALGIVVDDTVHFLHRLRRHTAAGEELDDAIRLTTREAGPGVRPW